MASPIICMSLIAKIDGYALYAFGSSMNNLDGRMKISMLNPREDVDILTESSIGETETMRAYSKLARVIEKGDVPTTVCRAS